MLPELTKKQLAEASGYSYRRRVTQNLLKMPSKVAPQLVMVGSADMIGAILDDEIRQTLTSLADTPLPGAADETEESAESGEDETGG